MPRKWFRRVQENSRRTVGGGFEECVVIQVVCNHEKPVDPAVHPPERRLGRCQVIVCSRDEKLPLCLDNRLIDSPYQHREEFTMRQR